MQAKGAIEAGAPEFIDLITSENKDYQIALGGGLMWLDNTCIDRYGKVYLDCTPEQQKEILDLIAYRKNFKKDPSLGQGIEFFGMLRRLTADGYFTSEIGIEYLGYIGNTFVKDFPGCPPVPGERNSEFVNHEGHEVSRRPPLFFLVDLRDLGGERSLAAGSERILQRHRLRCE